MEGEYDPISIHIVTEMSDPDVVGDIKPLIDPSLYGSTDFTCTNCGYMTIITRLRCSFCSTLRPEMRPAYTSEGVLYKRKDDENTVYM
jgi:hypothetical protein